MDNFLDETMVKLLSEGRLSHCNNCPMLHWSEYEDPTFSCNRGYDLFIDDVHTILDEFFPICSKECDVKSITIERDDVTKVYDDLEFDFKAWYEDYKQLLLKENL